MRIFEGAGSTIATGGKDAKIPRGGILYEVFGEGTNLVDFAPLLENFEHDTLTLLASIALRIELVDKLNILNRPPANADFASLQLYLLCTCIDTLANPTWLPFNDWLRTKKTKYHITERNEQLSSILENINNIQDIESFTLAILTLYKNYLLHHGTSKKFGTLFLESPDFLKEFIASSYMIFDGDKNYLLPEERQKWFEKTVDEKLSIIAAYLYKYRRNKFTHQSRSFSTTWESFFQTPEEALNTRPYKPSGALLHFWVDDNPQNDVELVVNTRQNEIFLLKNMLIVRCRKLLGLKDTEEFLRKREQRHHRSLIIKNVILDLEFNWKAYKFYSIKWLAYEHDKDRYNGLPEFQLAWLEAALELDYSEYGIPQDSILQDAKAIIRLLTKLNEPIRVVNLDFPPLYIRNRDSKWKDKPEDFKGKEEAKIELFERIQNMHEYHHVRSMIPNIIGTFSRLLTEVPDQKGPKFYSSSRPDYFSLL